MKGFREYHLKMHQQNSIEDLSLELRTALMKVRSGTVTRITMSSDHRKHQELCNQLISSLNNRSFLNQDLATCYGATGKLVLDQVYASLGYPEGHYFIDSKDGRYHFRYEEGTNATQEESVQ